MVNNPFKPDDKVLTNRKGIEIEATVRTIWNHEVQVRTADGDLLWRTMKTIRLVTAPETGQPADTPQDSASPAEGVQPEPVQVAQCVEGVEGVEGSPNTAEPVMVEPEPCELTTVEPATVEPIVDEPATGEPAADEPGAVEPNTAEPESSEPASQSLDQPAESEQQQPGKGAPKPKKRRKGILSKFINGDFDQ